MEFLRLSSGTNNVHNVHKYAKWYKKLFDPFFADDAKFIREARTWNDCEELQKDLGRVYRWS